MRNAVLACLLAASLAAAQVRVAIKPLSSTAIKFVYGGGRDVGLWTIDVCNYGATAVTVARADLMLGAPALHELPVSDAIDTLLRKAAADRRSAWSQIGEAGLGLGSAGLTIAGLRTKSPAMTYAGFGLTAVQAGLVLFRRIHAAPNPAPHLTELLPDEISLSPHATHGYCGSWTAVASLTPGAKTITFQMPEK